MTFYLRSYPSNSVNVEPYRRVRRWVEDREYKLGINVHEQDDAYVLSALVPGLKSDDLHIQVLDDVLRIEGEYKQGGTVDQQEENEYLLRELPSGLFARTLRLPAPIDADHVEAKIADGVLTLTLPKAESARPKRIQVQVK